MQIPIQWFSIYLPPIIHDDYEERVQSSHKSLGFFNWVPAGRTGSIPGHIPGHVQQGSGDRRGTQIGKTVFLEEHEATFRDSETRTSEQIKPA